MPIKKLKTTKYFTAPEQEKYPFGRWQYRMLGDHLWNTLAIMKPTDSARLYYKRGGIFTYCTGITEWRWSK